MMEHKRLLFLVSIGGPRLPIHLHRCLCKYVKDR